MLGYIFWRSFDQVTSRSRAALAGLGVRARWWRLRIVFARSAWPASPELRGRAARRLAAPVDRPLLGPPRAATPRRGVRGRTAGSERPDARGRARRGRGSARWARELELTTLLALAGVGGVASPCSPTSSRSAHCSRSTRLAGARRRAAHRRRRDARARGHGAGLVPGVAVAVLGTAAWAWRAGARRGGDARGRLPAHLAGGPRSPGGDRPRAAGVDTLRGGRRGLSRRGTPPRPSHGSHAPSCWCAAAMASRPASPPSRQRSGSALAVAATRIYLRVHYLSDVIGGLALGAGDVRRGRHSRASRRVRPAECGADMSDQAMTYVVATTAAASR